MIWFLVVIAGAMAVSIALMVRQRKSARELGLFVTIVLLGVADWMSIFLEKKFNPNHWIARFLEWIGL